MKHGRITVPVDVVIDIASRPSRAELVAHIQRAEARIAELEATVRSLTREGR